MYGDLSNRNFTRPMKADCFYNFSESLSSIMLANSSKPVQAIQDIKD